MALERQTTWGWLIVLDIFLGGMGSGVFAFGFVLHLLGLMKDVAQVSLLAGPVLLLLGLACLVAEMMAPIKRSFRFICGVSTSWMSRGILIQLLFLLFSIGYALPSFWLPWWSESVYALSIGVIAFLLALTTGAYHGLLLGDAKAIPLWSTPLLPLLFLLVSLCTGIGFVFLISLTFTKLHNEIELTKAFSLLAISGTVLISIKLISLGFFASVKSGITYSESISTLKRPLTVSAVLLIVCMALLVLGLIIGQAGYLFWISMACGTLLLVSGYIFRNSIIKGGCRYNLRIPI